MKKNELNQQVQGYIDAHCHLTHIEMIGGVEAILADCLSLGVSRFFLGGVDPDEWQRQVQLQRLRPDQVFMALGLHPWTVLKKSDESLEADFQILHSHLQNLKTTFAGRHGLAIGETGLDFAAARSRPEKNRQEAWCERQLALSREADLPLVIHVVAANARMCALLKAHRDAGGQAGLIHGFVGDLEAAKKFVNLGFLLSLGPRSIAKMAKDVIALLPETAIVIESDAPPGTPAVILEVGQAVADARSTSLAEVMNHARLNLARVFGF